MRKYITIMSIIIYIYIYAFLTDFQICKIFNLIIETNCDVFKKSKHNNTLSPKVKIDPIHFLANKTYNGAFPKIMHHMDNVNPSEQVTEWINTWVENYPDWTHLLWHDKEIDKLLVQWNYPNICKKHIEKIDYSRYVILWKWGGIYKDSDIIFRSKPDTYKDGIGIYDYSISNAYMSSRPKDPIWLDIFNYLKYKKIQPFRGPDFLNTCGPFAINMFLNNNARVYKIKSKCVGHVSTDRWSSESRRYDMLDCYFYVALFINIVAFCRDYIMKYSKINFKKKNVLI